HRDRAGFGCGIGHGAAGEHLLSGSTKRDGRRRDRPDVAGRDGHRYTGQELRSYSISGVVVGPSGSPVVRAFVGAYPVGDRGPSASGTTRRGEFVLNGLAPERYVVRASLTEPDPGDGPPQRESEM